MHVFTVIKGVIQICRVYICLYKNASIIKVLKWLDASQGTDTFQGMSSKFIKFLRGRIHPKGCLKIYYVHMWTVHVKGCVEIYQVLKRTDTSQVMP